MTIKYINKLGEINGGKMLRKKRQAFRHKRTSIEINY